MHNFITEMCTCLLQNMHCKIFIWCNVGIVRWIYCNCTTVANLCTYSRLWRYVLPYMITYLILQLNKKAIILQTAFPNVFCCKPLFVFWLKLAFGLFQTVFWQFMTLGLTNSVYWRIYASLSPNGFTLLALATICQSPKVCFAVHWYTQYYDSSH